MARISLDLAHSYKPNPQQDSDYALLPLKMAFEDGGAYALLGPSGCGKTTMLNIMSGLLVPSHGTVQFDGQDMTRATPQQRNIAQVFQFPVVYDTMTVRQNLAFPLRNRGMDSAYIKARVAQIAAMINTESLRAGPLEDSRKSDQQVSSSAYRELIVTDLRPELGRITAPTTVLYVRFNDPRMTNEITDGIYRASFANLPGATLTRIDDSAHFIMLDQPAVFAAKVNAFLE